MGRDSQLVLDLTAIEPPEPDPPPGIEIVTWADRPELAQGIYEIAAEATLDIPGEEENDIGSVEEWLERDMGGAGDDPRAVFVALAGDEVTGFAKFSLSTGNRERAFHDLTGVRRAWRGPRDRSGLEADADRLGEARGLHVAADVERGPQRADPPPERAPRLRRRAGQCDRSPRYRRDLSARSICRFASRSAIVRRLSPRSLPRPTAISTFTLPSLKYIRVGTIVSPFSRT